MKSSAELLKANLHYLTADFESWKSLFAEDAVMPHPYGAAAGVETPLYGITAILKSVAGFMNAVTNFRVTTPTIHQIECENAIIAEFTACADVVADRQTLPLSPADFMPAVVAQLVIGRCSIHRNSTGV